MATNIHNLFHLTITFGIFAAFQSVFLRHFIRYFCGSDSVYLLFPAFYEPSDGRFPIWYSFHAGDTS